MGGPLCTSVGSWFGDLLEAAVGLLRGFPSAQERVFVTRPGFVSASVAPLPRPVLQMRTLRQKDTCPRSHSQHRAELDFKTV